MTTENKTFLDDNLYHFINLERAFYLKNLMAGTKDRMEQVMGQEFAKGYKADLTCPVCVGDMVKLLYRRYFEWLQSETKSELQYKDFTEGIQEMNKIYNYATNTI